MPKMNEDERTALVFALNTILDSEPMFEEFENANYHSAWDFLSETRDELKRGDTIGYARWDDDE